ncbi:hypothetical protein BX600DRAFT_429775 [Xylariales sp. PMI_506]|nr:hypothetical protein BX600DRAFT_429775 [Xylariales sp. PMI_506]
MSDRPKNSAIAKWGAACAPCAQSKAKCIRSNENPGSKCDRCERLEKDCSDQIHRPRKKRQSKPSRTAQLEERLNSLVDLLKTSNAGELPAGLRNPPSLSEDSSCIPSETEPLASDTHRSPLSTGGLTSFTSPASANKPVEIVPATYNAFAPPSCICRAPIGEPAIPLQSDEVLLSIFVTKLTPHFPFVVLRPGISAMELAATRPLLFSTIKMVASVRNLKSMMAQKYAIMKEVSERMLLWSERTLEMLQTILLMLGYYHYHCMMHAQMSNLAALASSLTADLGISKIPELQERTRVLVLNPEVPKPRTNDERRALCGMWYMNSVVSMAFQKTEPVRYTAYIERCARELETEKEYETDILLGQLVRVQHLTDQISQLQVKDRSDEELPGIPRAPMSAYLSALQSELDKFKAQIPRHLRNNSLLMNHYHAAQLRLWEPPIVDAKLLHSLSDSFTSMSIGTPSSLDIFYRSNAALKAWFEFWLSVDVTEYFYLPMPICAQLIVSVTMLSRWAKLAGADSPPTPGGSLYARAAAEGIHDPSSAPVLLPPQSLASETGLQESEPAIASAITRIKAQIRSQPDLYLDVVGILRALVGRFEQARAQVSDVQGGKWDNNIWDLAARKISITKLKLERWAEIVSTVGAEGILSRKYEPGDGPLPPESAGPMDGVERSETVEHPAVPPVQEAWQDNNMFAHDLFDGLGLDQNFFYGDGDYGTAVLENLTFK